MKYKETDHCLTDPKQKPEGEISANCESPSQHREDDSVDNRTHQAGLNYNQLCSVCSSNYVLVSSYAEL